MSFVVVKGRGSVEFGEVGCKGRSEVVWRGVGCDLVI